MRKAPLVSGVQALPLSWCRCLGRFKWCTFAGGSVPLRMAVSLKHRIYFRLLSASIHAGGKGCKLSASCPCPQACHLLPCFPAVIDSSLGIINPHKLRLPGSWRFITATEGNTDTTCPTTRVCCAICLPQPRQIPYAPSSVFILDSMLLASLQIQNRES